MDYIVNLDISHRLLKFVTLQSILCLSRLNHCFYELVCYTTFYKQLFTLKNKTHRVFACYNDGLLSVLEKLRLSERPFRCCGATICAATHGQLKLLRWLHSHRRNVCLSELTSCRDSSFDCRSYEEYYQEFVLLNTYPKVAKIACKHNHLTILTWLAKKGYVYYYPENLIDKICKKGHVEILQFIYNHQSVFNYTNHAIEEAIKNNHLQVLQWFVAMNLNLRYSRYACIYAVCEGYVHILDWFVQNNLPFKCTYAHMAQLAARRNLTNVLDWLLQMGFQYTPNSTELLMLVSNDCRETVNWILDSNVPISNVSALIDQCIVKSNTHMLSIFRRSKHPFTYHKQAMTTAITKYRFYLMSWFKRKNIVPEYDSDGLNSVIADNRIDVLEFILSYQWPFNYSSAAVDRASTKGNLKMLQWLKNTGLPFKYTSDAINGAIIKNRIAILDWFWHANLPFKYDFSSIDRAALNGYLAVFEWFNQSGAPFTYSYRAIDGAAAKGHVSILQWFKDNQPPFLYSSTTIKTAIVNNQLTVLQWFKQNDLEIDCTFAILQELHDRKENDIIYRWFIQQNFDLTYYFDDSETDFDYFDNECFDDTDNSPDSDIETDKFVVKPSDVL